MIRSSCHTLKFLNKAKKEELRQLLEDYSAMINKYVNIVWNNNPLDNDQKMLSSEQCNKITTTRAHDSRLRQAAAKQVCSEINARWSKRRKQVFVLKMLQRTGIISAALQRKIDTNPITKPKIKNISMELDSRFFDRIVVDEEPIVPHTKKGDNIYEISYFS